MKTQHGMFIEICRSEEIESSARCVHMKTQQLFSNSTVTIRHSNIERLMLKTFSKTLSKKTLSKTTLYKVSLSTHQKKRNG